MTDASYPAPTGSSATAGARPSVLNTAFWLYLASIVVGVVATLLTIPQTQAQVAALGSSASSASGLVVASAIVGALLSAVIWGLFLFFLRRDHGWARWVLLALTVLSILRVVQGFGLGAVAEVLAIVATVLALLPASSAYLRDVAARRRATRA